MNRRALTIRRKVYRDGHPLTLESLDNLASVLELQGSPAEAQALYRDYSQLLHDKLPVDDRALAQVLSQLTHTLLVEGKSPEAEPTARESLRIYEKTLPDDWHTFFARSLLGDSLLGLNRYAEAEPLLLSGYEGMKQREDRIPTESKPRLKEALQRLARLYEGTGRPEQAAEFRKKLETFDKPQTATKAGAAASDPTK